MADTTPRDDFNAVTTAALDSLVRFTNAMGAALYVPEVTPSTRELLLSQARTAAAAHDDARAKLEAITAEHLTGR